VYGALFFGFVAKKREALFIHVTRPVMTGLLDDVTVGFVVMTWYKSE
jgi:hypothetical protein